MQNFSGNQLDRHLSQVVVAENDPMYSSRGTVPLSAFGILLPVPSFGRELFDRERLEQIQLIEDFPRSNHHAAERILCVHHRQTRTFADENIEIG